MNLSATRLALYQDILAVPTRPRIVEHDTGDFEQLVLAPRSTRQQEKIQAPDRPPLFREEQEPRSAAFSEVAPAATALALTPAPLPEIGGVSMVSRVYGRPGFPGAVPPSPAREKGQHVSIRI